ncbi:acetoin reductase [Staphylococcus haemolyticus]|uniref:acetoin reductase n=1 Tax=Staphylococcus haemolyticus TaxID=1283 RepID=UPI00069D6D76|nr:acetoin reductase [Staphylococcus haemolyticus]PTK85497.1 3-oxoacyl-ACP reductase [Staphylococcus haemolyticus]PTK98705.1 3-oxoacyl-ACP reductase [Staphylococcus haemolyticus]PTL15872.1 3-oxoacyl-ACP reductase [Staphylococcus haemolyticus]
MAKTAVITGSAAGLGKGIAERLANDGFNIVLQDINQDTLLKTEEEFKDKGFNVVAFHSDVSKKKEQEELVQFAVAEFGQIDVFVNNAGVDAVSSILEITEDELDKLFHINVYGTLFGIQAAAKQFIKQNSKGKIINACSIAGHESYEVLGTYCATKYSVRSFTQTAAKELAEKGITVNAYCPGVAKTEMWDRIDAAMVELDDNLKPGDAFEQFSSAIKLGRYQEPKDVAALVAFLASPDSDYITGQAILTDGGLVYR